MMTLYYSLHDMALSLPVDHPARKLYQDFKQTESNAGEGITLHTVDASGAIGKRLRDMRNSVADAVGKAVNDSLRDVPGFAVMPFDQDGKQIVR